MKIEPWLNKVQWRIQDFPEVGAPTLAGGGRQHIILPIFPKNCMELKEFGGDARDNEVYYQNIPMVKFIT